MGADTVTVTLRPTDGGQLTVNRAQVTFSAANTNTAVVVSVTEDNVAELERVFAIRLTPQEGIPAVISSELSVIVPENDAPTVRVMVERAVIPEGELASVLIDADLVQELTVNLALSGFTGAQTDVSLSSSTLTLTPDNPSALVDILVADNEEPQAANGTFNVDLSTEFTPPPELPSLTFTVPPNDLIAQAATRVEFTLEHEKATTQTMTVSITPELRGSKGFVVSSEDSRLVVITGLITSAQPSFPVELALREGVVLGREERLGLSISHLDSWRQRSAQAQLSAGHRHSCGIRAGGEVACWGDNSYSQSSPTSGPRGVAANARFLAVSAGYRHSCGIRADNTVACWGNPDNGRTDPTSSPQGVTANARFLAVSAGSFHNCGITADSRVACWGNSGNGRTDPTSGPRGVDANARFLSPQRRRHPQLRHQGGQRGGLLGR